MPALLRYTGAWSQGLGAPELCRCPWYASGYEFDNDPEEQPFGLTPSAILVGAQFATGLGADGGRAEYGKYPVMDLAGLYFIDAHCHLIIAVRLENVLDRKYATP